MTWPVAFNLAISLLTALSLFYGIRSSRRGKLAEIRQASIATAAAKESADRTQSLTELDRSLTAMRSELDYYEAQMKAARAAEREALTEKERLQQEWIERHRKLLARCQQLAEQIQAILSGPIKLHPAQQVRLEQAIEEVAQHIVDDHEHFD
jgi:chromosome segregation ATPase